MIYSYFTTPDPSLTQDSSVDPMGLEPIWVHYGQQVFVNRITSVASDIRGFTINAFHHYVLDRFLLQQDALVRLAKERYKGWSDRQEVKAGLLILLEDLLTYIFYQAPDKGKEIEKLGILGLLKANARFRDGVGNFRLQASKKAGLLKSQISLGFTGRYRNPMIMMGFFDKKLGYLPGETTQASTALFEQWLEAQQLASAIDAFLQRDLLVQHKKRLDYPEILLADLISRGKRWEQLRDGYLAMFGNSHFPARVRQFWLKILRFDKGAAAALYQALNGLDSDQKLNYEAVLREALKTLLPGSIEAKQIEDILSIQPLLSHVEYLVRYMAHPQSPAIDKMRDQIADMRQSISFAASQIPGNAIPALKKLAVLVTAGESLEDWLLNIFDYHRKIMEKRGGTPWFELDRHMHIRHFFSPATINGGSDMTVYLKERPWLHTFYLNTLMVLKNGLT